MSVIPLLSRVLTAAVALSVGSLLAAPFGREVAFSLKTAKADGSDVKVVSASEMTHVEEQADRLVWKGHPVLGADFTAVAELQKTAGGVTWGFAYSGNASDRRIEEITFPEWRVKRTDRTRLFMPHYNGRVVTPVWADAKDGALLASEGSCFKGFNAAAVMEPAGVSHYLDMRGESRHYATRFAVRKTGADACTFSCIHEMPLTPESKRAYRIPYTGTMAEYRGDWFEACAIYRTWVKTQAWYRKAAARTFPKLRDVALWMWNRGKSDVTVPPALQFMKDTGLKVALDWYWWHNVPYDTAYPFFWPPREPLDAYKAGIRAVQAAGGYVQPYTNGMLWDCDDARWANGGEDCTLVERNGKTKATMFNPYTKQRQAWMCGEAPQFHTMMRTLERTIREAGMDGVYMDMIASAGAGSCFNPRHRHPQGGGRHVVDGYRAYVEQVRADNPGFYLSSEEFGEPYLDVFDSFINVYPSCERFGCGIMPREEYVPAAMAVFHGAIVAFGSFATMDNLPPWDEKWGTSPFGAETTQWEEKYPDQFAVEFARGVSWGLQPTVHKFLLEHATSPRFASYYAFVKDTARFYFENRDLLFDGEMLEPGRLTCEKRRVEFLQRSAYTKPEKVKTNVQPALPTLFVSAWQSKAGARAAVIGNWSREAQKYVYEQGGCRYEGTVPARSWVRLPLEPVYDVVVAGGGVAAVSAALAAREAGASVLVLAPRPALSDDVADTLRLGCPAESAARTPYVERVLAARGRFASPYGDFTPLGLKRVADEALAAAGVEVRTFTASTAVLRDAAGHVAGLETASRDGTRIVRARCVIDATERATLAREAGAVFRPFAGGPLAFERRVIAAEPPSAAGMTVEELGHACEKTQVQGIRKQWPAGVVTGRFWRCTATLPMQDLSPRALAEAEQKMRDLTWVPTTLDASDHVRFFPPDRLTHGVDGVFVASLVGEMDEAKARARYDDWFADAAAAASVGTAAARAARSRPEPGAPKCGAAELPVLADCDVFVAGLGTGGAPAAITAAREGVRTIGCDYLHKMGGLMTEGLIGSYCWGYRGGFTAEIDAGVKGFGVVYPQAKAEWFRQEARKAGAELFFGAWVTGVRVTRDTTGARLSAVEVVLRDGTRGLVTARAFIDATGNADLAAAAGEETEFIRADELSLQGAGSTQDRLGSCYRNADIGFVDDTDAADLAFFMSRARGSMADWAWDQTQIVASRERRRLRGAYSVTVQDAFLGRTYRDVIAVTKSNFDTHGQTFDEQFFIEDPGRGGREVKLPYRCLLPKTLDGLLVIGLGMSAHRDAMPILRMQPDVQNQGYVAGLAAATALKAKVALRAIDMPTFQQRLADKQIIPQELVGAKDNFPLSDECLANAADSLRDNYRGLPELLTDRARAIPLLRARYAAAPADGLVYAHVLGLLGDPTGVATLAAAVDGKPAWDEGWNYRGMHQFGRSVSMLDSYLIALGRTRDPKAFDALDRKAALLKGDDRYSHFRAVALAYEALGDRRGVSALVHLLRLPGVAGHACADGATLPKFTGYADPKMSHLAAGDAERSEVLRELCLARALYRLGDSADRLGACTLQAYARDPRRAYAAHARKVLD